MPLMNDVFQICTTYAAKGWGNFFQQNFGLDITQDSPAKLAAELNRRLNFDPVQIRNIPGFRDFASNAKRGIEPGDPAKSLLFHAFSSPDVKPLLNEEDYLAAEELAILENYVWVASVNGPKPPTLNDIAASARQKVGDDQAELAVVVFAQEYRQGHESVHHRHADMAFSRTGVARIGTEEAHYSRRDRGYWSAIEGQPKSMRVIPAQYAPYIAVRATGGNLGTFGPLSLSDDAFDENGDRVASFWVPVHKLFKSPSGENECLAGIDLSRLKLEAHHVNEKLRHVHQELNNLHFPAEKNAAKLKQAPYFITDKMIATVSPLGQVVPKPQPLVAVAKDGSGNRIAFEVPRTFPDGNSSVSLEFGNQDPDGDFEGKSVSLFDRTTFQFNAVYNGQFKTRKAPEYLHIRHDAEGDRDLNSEPKISKQVSALVGTAADPRQAFHYMDFTGDGWVTVVGFPLNDTIKDIFPAFSIVSAPDFYPLVSQYELIRWVKNNSDQEPETWKDIPPNVLSANRMPANIQLSRGGDGKPVVFGEGDPVFDLAHSTSRSITAVVSLPIARKGSQILFHIDRPEVKRQPTLPDSASGIFAPGWDVSADSTHGVEHLAAYGLGSPFPEDAKLCAALSGFWPAASPDTAITFNVTQKGRPIIAPMTDREIKGDHPWDGVQGPRLVRQADGRIHAIYPNYYHTDYVIHADKGEFSLAETSTVTTSEYIRRIIVMQKVNKFLERRALDPRGRPVDLNLFSFQAIDNGAGSPKYRFEYAAIDRTTQRALQADQGGPRFFQATVTSRRTIEVTVDGQPVEVAHQPL